MEYCAVQGPIFDGLYEVERCDVRQVDGLVLAAIFAGKRQELPILELLADKFLLTVSKCIRRRKDIECAVKSAFTRMDGYVKKEGEVDKSTSNMTRICVVDLPNQVVYSMGSLLVVPAIVSDDSQRRLFSAKEYLKPTDRHVVVATRYVNRYRVACIRDILETRIRRVGLLEACKDIVGKYADIVPKTLIVVTLRKDVHLPYPHQPQLPVAPWEDCLRSLQERRGDSDDSILRLYDDPRSYLRPLKENEICQQPEPITTVIDRETLVPGHLGTIEVRRVSEGLKKELKLEPEAIGNKRQKTRHELVPVRSDLLCPSFH